MGWSHGETSPGIHSTLAWSLLGGVHQRERERERERKRGRATEEGGCRHMNA
jgi:hypothetical protein